MDYLGKTVRVKLFDGRTIYGSLVCLNRSQDLILSNSIEQQSQEFNRFIGMVVVPGTLLKSISLQHFI